MRLVHDSSEMERLFPAASGEAEAAFGDGRMYLEKVILNPHHVEVQILGDGRGGEPHAGGEGLFNPATEPEDTGGVTFTAGGPPDEGAATSSRAQCVCTVELPKRRNSGVPAIR